MPNEASSHAKHPSSLGSSTTKLTSSATTNNDHANDLKASVLSAGVTDVSLPAADISSSAVAQPSPSYGGCGSACWMILGPVIAGVVVAAMVFGLVMTKRRRRLRAQTELDLKANKSKANDGLDDDDLMVEMFEPPELLSSGNISGAFFNWRNASSPPDGAGGKESRRGSAQFSGRSTALGLTTILEEGSSSPYEQQQRIKKYHGNIRRPSGKGSDAGMLSPLKLTSPHPVLRGPLAGVGGMRAMSLADTPPLSPLISPTASPAPSDTGGGLAHAAPGQQLYLTAPVGGRPKRKLTIPYNPQDVTRRRSLEGAW